MCVHECVVCDRVCGERVSECVVCVSCVSCVCLCVTEVAITVDARVTMNGSLHNSNSARLDDVHAVSDKAHTVSLRNMMMILSLMCRLAGMTRIVSEMGCIL